MAASGWVKTLGDGILYIEPTGYSFEITLDVGDFKYSDPRPARIPIYDRNAIGGVRYGKDPVIAGSFSVHFREFTCISGDALLDIINGTHGTGVAQVALTSTGGTGFEPFMASLRFKKEATAMDSLDHTDTFAKTFFAYDYEEGDSDKVVINWECYGGHTRAAA